MNKNRSHDLFSLMFNLSKLSDKEEILRVFIDGLNESFGIQFFFSESSSTNVKAGFELKTAKNYFGIIYPGNQNSLSGEDGTLVENACQMLAVLLHRLTLEEKLTKEKQTLEEVAKQRLNEIEDKVEELKKTRNASLNLIEDLTEEIEKRIKYENKLKDSEEKYRLVLDNSVDAVMVTLPDDRAISANRAACEMFQMTEEEICNAGKEGLVNLDDPNLPKLIGERNKYGKAKGELTFYRKDGTLFPAEITTAVFWTSKGEQRSSLIIRDITERKLIEEKRKSSDRIFEHSIDMMAIAGFDGYFKVLNPAWERTLGWSNEELLSNPWNKFIHPDDIVNSDNISAEIMDGHAAYRFENRYISKDGSYRWFSWNTFPYPEENIMFAVARDITEHKKADEELRKLKDNLQYQVEQKTQELKQRVAELEKFQKATIEREFRIKELRSEIETLKK
ncbi:PAS domain S-box-containing protein [Mariniphaga anaerophila]|uniref:histidine kinase n=1 Tax=Mariniphaga anaerophila TaxID=1484053 RepID=A0A1M4SPP7_9BACT|nr:PAS domain S-box protein [Mariniphaga anaerophila]SHE34190.1 PAS domain S-box-containing protein [Mariniphaga anaerophila]